MNLTKKIGVCIVLIGLLSACKSKEDDDSSYIALLLAAGGYNTCSFSPAGTPTSIASMTAIANGTPYMLSFTQIDKQYSAIQIPVATAGSVAKFQVSAGTLGVAVYKGGCPIVKGVNLAAAGTDFVFISGSATITSSAQIQFNVAGSYTIIVNTADGGVGTFQLN
ncbi:hypothetical protein A0128_10235 [Leptospira tipperaryensis]|uniref:Lipoprotein n=1 Tax=Leptospira tipperaryensis TaxID=2564040 RepID=A0A1D7UXC3_9LEPT|nr:hypothetical protein [Leptospira tipperaryensis]AOP34191.1 hypothetical protein A0128_10235 [Leptospira tipperaryensis]